MGMNWTWGWDAIQSIGTCVSALGTVGACIVALYLANRKEKPVLKCYNENITQTDFEENENENEKNGNQYGDKKYLIEYRIKNESKNPIKDPNITIESITFTKNSSKRTIKIPITKIKCCSEWLSSNTEEKIVIVSIYENSKEDNTSNKNKSNTKYFIGSNDIPSKYHDGKIRIVFYPNCSSDNYVPKRYFIEIEWNGKIERNLEDFKRHITLNEGEL